MSCLKVTLITNFPFKKEPYYIKNLMDLYQHSFCKFYLYEFYADVGHGESEFSFTIRSAVPLQLGNNELYRIKTQVYVKLPYEKSEHLEKWIWTWGERGPSFVPYV